MVIEKIKCVPREVGEAPDSIVLTHGMSIVKGVELCPPKICMLMS